MKATRYGVRVEPRPAQDAEVLLHPRCRLPRCAVRTCRAWGCQRRRAPDGGWWHWCIAHDPGRALPPAELPLVRSWGVR